MKRFLVVSCFLVLALSGADAVSNEFLSKQKKADVTISINDRNGNLIASGAGLFLDENGVVSTQCNLILKWLEDVEYILIVKTGEGYFHMDKLISCSRKKDLATFRIETEPFKIALPSGVPDKVPAKPQTSPLAAKIPETPAEPRKYKKTPDRLENAETFFQRGFMYYSMKNYKNAIEAYKQAISIKPDYLDAYINLGQAYYKLGRYSDAIDAYERAVKLKPDPTVYNKIGTLYIVMGKYYSAIDSFKQALVMEPKSPDTHFNIGITHFLNGDKDAAYEEYIILNKLDRERAENLFDLIYR